MRNLFPRFVWRAVLLRLVSAQRGAALATLTSRPPLSAALPPCHAGFAQRTPRKFAPTLFSSPKELEMVDVVHDVLAKEVRCALHEQWLADITNLLAVHDPSDGRQHTA